RIVAIAAAPGAALHEEDGRQQPGVVRGGEGDQSADLQAGDEGSPDPDAVRRESVSLREQVCVHGGKGRPLGGGAACSRQAACRAGAWPARRSTKNRRSWNSPFLPMLKDDIGRW